MQEEGFHTHIDVKLGAERVVEALVSGLIANPESIYYRNAKWLKELTQIGSKNHRELLSLLDVPLDCRA
jgi:hypothetical protein